MDRYADWRWDPADRSPDPATTYRLSRPQDSSPRSALAGAQLPGQMCYVKLRPVGASPRLPDEAMKLRWAQEQLPVPHVIEYGSDGDLDWLITEGLSGVVATAHPWCADDPRRLVVALAEGLRRFHDSAAVDDCPFMPETALAELSRSAPTSEELVVCHGDFGLPKVMLTNGRISGYLGLAQVAVVDRWWDLANGAHSCARYLGTGFEELFFQAYGAKLDPARTAWYRLLYDLID